MQRFCGMYVVNFFYGMHACALGYLCGGRMDGEREGGREGGRMERRQTVQKCLSMMDGGWLASWWHQWHRSVRSQPNLACWGLRGLFYCGHRYKPSKLASNKRFHSNQQAPHACTGNIPTKTRHN